MPSKSFLRSSPAALLFALACSSCNASDPAVNAGGGGSGGSPAGSNTGGNPMGGNTGGVETSSGGMDGMLGDQLLFVPEGLPNTEVGGGDEGLNLVAFTMLQRPNGPELYAAVRNDGETPLCNAGLITNFYDEAGQQLGTSGTALHSGRLYRLNDDSGTITSCVAPGQIAMAASTDLADSIVIDEVAYLEHTFPAFGLDVIFLDATALSELQIVSGGAGSAYTGTLSNLLDAAVRDPSVQVFPLNRAGRPLGFATLSEVTDVGPGGRWVFETSSVEDAGVGYAAFATVKL